VDSALTLEEVLVEEFCNIELYVSFPGSLIYITCSFISLASEFPEYLNHLFISVSNKLRNREKLVVLGDFNIPGTSWSTG